MENPPQDPTEDEPQQPAPTIVVHNHLEPQPQTREALHTRIDTDFVYHKPDDARAALHTSLREAYRVLAHRMANDVPVGRSLSLALTKLEEAVMHANAAIARGR